MTDSQTSSIASRLRRNILRPFPSRSELYSQARPLLLCLLSGLSGALLFHQNWLGLLGWICLIPFYIATSRLSGKMLAWGALLFGFLWYYLSCWWLHTLVVFHWLIPLGVVVGALYFGMYFLLFAFPASWCQRYLPPNMRPWAIAVCWTAVEYLRNFTDMAFPWNLLGHSQVPFNQSYMQLTSIGGIYLVSFLMALVNAGLAGFLISRSNRGAKLHPVNFSAIILLAIVPFFLPDTSGIEPDSTLKVSVVQPGVSQLKRWNAMMGFPDDTSESYNQRYQQTAIQMQETAGSLMREAARQDFPRLMVLPESAFLGSNFPYETGLHAQLAEYASHYGTDIFLGADNLIDREAYDFLAGKGQRFLLPDDQATTFALPLLPVRLLDDGTTVPDFAMAPDNIITVAAWHISRDKGLDTRVYNKMQLVPFGEMIPFVGGVKALRDLLEAGGIAGAFKPGMENTVFEIDGTRFGTVICFESTFSYLTRYLARAGAKFICVLTNDSWYNPQYAIEEGGFWGALFKFPGIHQLASAAPRQHLIHSQLRAIETGLPVVRSANTGISAVINSDGKILESLPYSQGGFLTGEVPIFNNPHETVYTRWGDWVGLICTGFWMSLVLVIFGGRITKKKSAGV